MRKLTLSLIAAFVMSTTPHAATTYSGNFLVPGPVDFIPSISGDWSFTFDETQVTTGDQLFYNLALDTLTFFPDPLGTTTFDTSNTFAYLAYINGTLDTLSLYGAPSFDAIDFSQDDFLVSYFANGVVGANWNSPNASVPFSASSRGSGYFETSDISAVPLPASAWLFLSGLAGLGWVGRRRNQAT